MTTYYNLAILISEYRHEYEIKTFKRLGNLRKAIKEYCFKNPNTELYGIDGFRINGFHDHNYEYTITLY